MIKYSIIFLFLFVVTQISTSQLEAQNTVIIESFSTAKGEVINGEQVRKLYNARFKTGNATLRSDSLYQYVERKEFRAFGNIQIDTPTENIWADTLFYYTDRDLSELKGRVIIKQDSTLLFGNDVDYDFFFKTAYFNDGIRLEDSNGILKAETGVYFQNIDSAIFRGNVQIQDSLQYVEGDSLFINRKSELFRLFNNIYLEDKKENTYLRGDYLEADSTGRRLVSGNSYLKQITADTTDTSHIFANQILVLEQDTTTKINAYGEVTVWTEQFSSLSDTLLYDSQSEIFKLISNPKAWHENIQLSGPFIEVELDSNTVKLLKSFPTAFAVQEDSLTGRLNQLKGDTLTAYFDDGNINEIHLSLESEILYHTINYEDEPDGAIENKSPKTILYFKRGELVRAWMGQTNGLFLPETIQLKNRKLEGFVYNPDLKPNKPTLILAPRLIPPSPERPFKLPNRFVEFMRNLK